MFLYCNSQVKGQTRCFRNIWEYFHRAIVIARLQHHFQGCRFLATVCIGNLPVLCKVLATFTTYASYPANDCLSQNFVQCGQAMNQAYFLPIFFQQIDLPVAGFCRISTYQKVHLVKNLLYDSTNLERFQAWCVLQVWGLKKSRKDNGRILYMNPFSISSSVLSTW